LAIAGNGIVARDNSSKEPAGRYVPGLVRLLTMRLA